jgi:hypothetical protein
MKFATVAMMSGALLSGAPGARAEVAKPEPPAPPSAWEPTTWCGEPAYAATCRGWRAVVSVERGRLVAFGPAGDAGRNLLFAPPTRSDPAGWGGHRAWLGPQDTWPGGWPPAKAWEYSAAAKAGVSGVRLTLDLPPSGGDWPDLLREYFWSDDALHCRVYARGGHRPAQIIEILQVRPEAVVTVQARPEEHARHGYVQLHLGRTPSPQPVFTPPPHVTERGHGGLELRFLNRTEKLGFKPQPLSARIDDVVLEVSPGEMSGEVVSTPDEGFVTQVYLGSGENQLIELEQLSPMFRSGSPAMFELVLRAHRLR